MMKNIKTYTLMIVLAILMVNCKNDDESGITVQQEATQKLSVTWSNAEVLDSPGGGSAGTLEDLTLTFEANESLNPTSFTATGAPDYLQSQANSTWSWENVTSTGSVNLINVAPVQRLTIDELTETTLTISFLYGGPENGRVKGIGDYQLRLMRQ